jgi:single-stranded-DNA-specific exonuclease
MRAGPFGAGNPEPVFVLPAHRIAYADVVGQHHIRARLRSADGTMLNAMAFRSVNTDLGRALIEGRGQAFHAAGTLSVDRWQGAERVQMRLIDVAPADRIG